MQGLVAAQPPGPDTAHRAPLGLIEFLDSSGGTAATVRGRQRIAVEGALLADRLGYRRVWVPEHHDTGSPSTNPLPLVAVLGSHTTRIRVGGAVSLVRIRDPHLTAEDLVTAGLFCGDRLDVGLGRGDVADDAAKALAYLRKDDAGTRLAVTTITRVLDLGCSWISPLGAPYQRWLHGAGITSAVSAGEWGFDYCHALFLNPDLDACLTALEQHRNDYPAGRRAVAVALVANSDPVRARVDSAAQRGVQVACAGTAEQCAATVTALLELTGADEVVIAELSRDGADHRAALASIYDGVAGRVSAPCFDTAGATVGPAATAR